MSVLLVLLLEAVKLTTYKYLIKVYSNKNSERWWECIHMQRTEIWKYSIQTLPIVLYNKHGSNNYNKWHGSTGTQERQAPEIMTLFTSGIHYTQANRTFSPGRPSDRSTTAYFPLIFQPGSSLSNRSAMASPLSPSPTTTSLLIVRRLQIFGAPAALAIGPIEMSNGMLAGAAQSYVSFLWFRSPLKYTRSERDRWRKRSGASL